MIQPNRSRKAARSRIAMLLAATACSAVASGCDPYVKVQGRVHVQAADAQQLHYPVVFFVALAYADRPCSASDLRWLDTGLQFSSAASVPPTFGFSAGAIGSASRTVCLTLAGPSAQLPATPFVAPFVATQPRLVGETLPQWTDTGIMPIHGGFATVDCALRLLRP